MAEDAREPAAPAADGGTAARPDRTAATRQALVKAALALFLERGFKATRMSDVAAAAGLAKGTTYLHFKDKESLFADVLRGVLTETGGRRRIGRPRPDEPTRAFLLRTVPPILRELQASGRFGILYLMAREGPQFPAVADTYHETVIVPVLRLVRIYARRAERRGEVRSDALSRLPIIFVAPAILSALWNNLFGRASPLDVAAVFEGYLDLLFGPAPAGSDGPQQT
ncbi:TetR/AcrR family transcriptional regulator [Aurantimonas sp. MSK8Z-1]|uniref:TetR/AcrR family transcriptional regulator n=1 Tax=Mangrovibrevibacter kandeliae TaxID=2968473 RepID=UPI002118BB00|nr:TetR/AcrR family transcriptional regulator [Aurantimonas sp. MSK8Z-1]MCW4116865.1 TetR/AcrR family transcriptional regulator [Aurantimonas sp. MSK8Z-1]